VRPEVDERDDREGDSGESWDWIRVYTLLQQFMRDQDIRTGRFQLHRWQAFLNITRNQIDGLSAQNFVGPGTNGSAPALLERPPSFERNLLRPILCPPPWESTLSVGGFADLVSCRYLSGDFRLKARREKLTDVVEQ